MYSNTIWPMRNYLFACYVYGTHDNKIFSEIVEFRLKTEQMLNETNYDFKLFKRSIDSKKLLIKILL